MAAVLKLTRYGASDLDLINGTDGIYLELNGWVRKVAQGDERVIEVLTLRIVGTSEDNIAAITGLIEEMRRDARRYMDSPLEDREVRLEVQLTGETNSYHALVTDLELSPMDDFYTYATSVQFTARYKLAIERMPFWERTASRNDSFAQVNSVGGADTYAGSSDPQGHEPSRIKVLSFGPYSAASPGGPITEIWAGFKSSLYGITLAGLWDLFPPFC